MPKKKQKMLEEKNRSYIKFTLKGIVSGSRSLVKTMTALVTKRFQNYSGFVGNLFRTQKE